MNGVPASIAAFMVFAPLACLAYPLDGYPSTAIKRLEAYRLAAGGAQPPSFLTGGGLLSGDAIRLNLIDHGDFELPGNDAALTSRIISLLGGDASAYAIAVLDYSDASRPRYAEHNAGRPQSPGSVGKVVLMLAWFQALADIHPEEKARMRLLRETVIEADSFIRHDAHDVPIWDFGDPRVERRPIVEGDRANLWTFLDWTASASSNAAASMLMKHLILLRHFEDRYPVPKGEADAWLAAAPATELSRIFVDAIDSPVMRSGMSRKRLRQGHFFTREGRNRVPGESSTCTSGELLRYLVLMEQGRLVDPWSSLQIKKLLYLTDERIRYASSPALSSAAVYFKSGSLYGCRDEPGFDCGKFRGDRMNFMNSMVIVESLDRTPALRYAVVVLSNVLRKDSSDLHRELGSRLHRAIESLHPQAPESTSQDPGPSEPRPNAPESSE